MHGPQIRLLLVEESEEEARVLLQSFSERNIHVQRVETRADAEKVIKAGEFELVITTSASENPKDIVEFIRHLSPDVSFVIVSADDDDEQVVANGIGEWVHRSEMHQLPDVVSRLLELSASERRVRYAERELSAQAKRYRRLFESTPVALWEIDACDAWRGLVGDDGDLDEALDTAAATVVVRHANDEARSFEPNDLRQIWIALLQAYLTGSTDFRLEYRFANGVDGLITARLPRAADNLGEVIVALLDVTQQRHLQQAFLAAQRMEAVGQLAAGIAHDFNNILMVVGTYAEFLRESIASNPQATEDLEVIVDGVQRATALVGQLLAFTRRQAQKLERLDLNEVVTKTERMLTRVLGEDVDLRTELADDLQAIDADAGQLDQVLMNLVVNARDAMPEGGELTLRTRSEHLTQSKNHPPGFNIDPGRYTVLSVQDTGLGMPREVAERVFEPFFSTKADRGSGLGLSTVYGIVKQSGGYITLESDVGKGTLFEIYFPIATTNVDAPEVAASLDALLDAEGAVVLLVEDNENVRRAAKRMLEERGYKVLAAADPQVALEIADSHSGTIDVLVTDVVLPGMNGVVLQHRVRDMRPKIGVVFTSGYTDHGALRQALERRDAVFVQKPMGIEDLDRAISTVRRRMS